VGATRKRRADFRLVAATNRDLAAEVAAGRFRKDLFYRVNGVRVVVPPLRERPEDIPPLVEHFSRSLGRPRPFAPEALAALAAHDWPGNVRELRFAVERALLLAEGAAIERHDLPPEIRTAPAAGASRANAAAALPAAGGERAPDAARVRHALEQVRWNRQKAAALLGVSPRTLFRWMQKLGL
jgi:DNA-binding NtrC family response regulator